MFYTLTEEEYRNLLDAAKNTKLANAKKLQTFCTRVANELPIEGWHAQDGGKAPWGCILTEKHEWYCDDCPAQEFCPHSDKHWSQ